MLRHTAVSDFDDPELPMVTSVVTHVIYSSFIEFVMPEQGGGVTEVLLCISACS
jgi:hypothetical protein